MSLLSWSWCTTWYSEAWKGKGTGTAVNPGWEVAAWKACGDCQTATLTKR
jgi:hypothetical protein